MRIMLSLSLLLIAGPALGNNMNGGPWGPTGGPMIPQQLLTQCRLQVRAFGAPDPMEFDLETECIQKQGQGCAVCSQHLDPKYMYRKPK
jgi:hypothetical protein